MKTQDPFTDKAERLQEDDKRQRLAERLFNRCLEMPDDTVLDDACKMDTYPQRRLTEASAFFSESSAGPHENQYRGRMLQEFKLEVTPVVMRLSEFEVGSQG